MPFDAEYEAEKKKVMDDLAQQAQWLMDHPVPELPPLSEEPAPEKKKKEKKALYKYFKEYFLKQFPKRRFCPIKQELFVRTNYESWETAVMQESILKSLAHENNMNHALVKDHLLHWASLKEANLHEKKMLVDLPEWDGVDRIIKFYSALPVKNFKDEHAYQLFKHFLANIWRRLENPKNRNWALILVGDQNVGKDWWIRELLGAWDVRYYFENLNVFDDEIRTFMQIDGKVIINISEFDNTKKWDPAFLKDLITKEDLSYIGKYRSSPKHNEARHTIIASANKMDFLQDYTGSTRFLIFDLGKGGQIDQKAYPLNESIQVLAQSKVLYKEGFVASQEAIKALQLHQDSVTPENIPEMIKTNFHEILTLKDAKGMLGGEPEFHPIDSLDSDIEILCKRYHVTREKLFSVLKEDFGYRSHGKRGYKRRVQ